MQQIFKFKPLLKRIRWGGRRLGTHLNKPIGAETDYAESWEISDHGADQSIVTNGTCVGKSLHQLLADCGDDLLGRYAGLHQFPLLIKYLDASDRLSVQVHPDDRLAKSFDSKENGKTEAWVILDAKPNSRLFAGLKPEVTPSLLREKIQTGDIEDCLNSFVVQAGECVFLPAGTVHAIGEGIVLAEVQQSSDLTFRLYDWGRLGSDGKPRSLHIEEAFGCIDFERGPVMPVTPVKLTTNSSVQQEELVRCEYFVMRRHVAAEPFEIESNDRFHILMALSGSAAIECGSEAAELRLGETLLVSASSQSIAIKPTSEIALLEAFLP